MPAYNEAAGIAGFIDEIRASLGGVAGRVSFVVVDDASTDDTARCATTVSRGDVRVISQGTNRGHGPTSILAYRTGLDLGADVVVHVDGDGQFLGSEFPRVLAALTPEVDVVHGVRMQRDAPWYRRILTAALRVTARAATGRTIRDVNTPLRAYRPGALLSLITAVEQASQVPHVHFSIAEARWGLAVREVRVRSLPRRGGETGGTMWGLPETPRFPPPKFRRFVWMGGKELWRDSLRRRAPLRTVPGDPPSSDH